ncbi:hypothetical protein ACICHK_02065 [Streptomyces sp. AHU1]|uniref:hypothetical protein n=1 Tax=Streptomyces sp. AHU1 TaxID=3377215 RepID=UPI00387790B4
MPAAADAFGFDVRSGWRVTLRRYGTRAGRAVERLGGDLSPGTLVVSFAEAPNR